MSSFPGSAPTTVVNLGAAARCLVIALTWSSVACTSGSDATTDDADSEATTGTSSVGAAGAGNAGGPTALMGGGSSGGGGAPGGTGAVGGDGGVDDSSDQTLPLTGEPCAGYTLVSNSANDSSAVLPATLVDMDGNVVRRWDLPGFPVKMLPGGSVVGCTGVFPNSYDCVEMRQLDWDGQLEWSFSNWVEIDGGTTAARQHHDFQRQGNSHGSYAPGQSFTERGNTLVLAHVNRSIPEIRDGVIEDDVIYEIDWSGELSGFSWYGADYYDQLGFDADALNDIRTHDQNALYLEFLHGNSISRLGPNHWYDEGHSEFHPDNIIYSSRSANLILIIDYGTGEIVWRIGPEFANRPEQSLGQFMGQHNPYMIPRGLPGAGNMLVFDNGGPSGYGGTATSGLPNRHSRDYSRVVEFDPVSLEILWEYGGPSGEQHFYSYLISNAQRLPNGNTLITIGMEGRVIEVTPDKRLVWEYLAVPESSPNNHVYRSYRIPPEWLPEGENESLANYATWASLFE